MLRMSCKTSDHKVRCALVAVGAMTCMIVVTYHFAAGACLIQCRESYCWGAGDGVDCGTYEPYQAFSNYYATQSDGVNYDPTGATTDYWDSYTCTEVCGGSPGGGSYQEEGACGLDVQGGTFTLYMCWAGS